MKYETNPNEPNSKKAKMNVSTLITIDYENISIWAKRTQSKPILAKKCKNKPKTNQISEVKNAETNPKQTQFHMVLACFSSRAKNADAIVDRWLRKFCFLALLARFNLR